MHLLLAESDMLGASRRWQESLELLQERLFDADVWGIASRGECLVRLGRCEEYGLVLAARGLPFESLRPLAAAAELAPGCSPWWVALAISFLDEARRTVRVAVEMEGATDQVRRMAETIESM